MRNRIAFGLDQAPRDLWEAALKTVVRWHDFSGAPVTRDEALALFAAQWPAATEEERRATLDAVVAVYQRALQAVPQHVRSRRFKMWPFASHGDIDSSACMRELEEVGPTVPRDVTSLLLGWVIHWHWER